MKDPRELMVEGCLDVMDKRSRHFKQELDAMKERETQLHRDTLRMTFQIVGLLDRVRAAEQRTAELEKRLYAAEEQLRATADDHAPGEIGRA